MNIYSKIDPTLILHIINRVRDVQQGRVDLVEPDNFLQVAVMRHGNGKTFQAHRHIERCTDDDLVRHITQESWVVIKGLVEVFLYDIDNELLHCDVLEPGDISITLGEGGHNYKFIADDSIVYEYKTGPYYGYEKDKIAI